MERTTFEGTWEEVAGRAAELAGRRVRVIVLEDRDVPARLDQALAALLAEAEELGRKLEGRPGTDRAWAEGVPEKFLHQGFR